MPSLIFRRERKSGVRWVVRFPTGEVDEKGKAKFESKTFRLHREARDHPKTLEAARDAGKAVNESHQALTQFMIEYLDAIDIRSTTKASYEETFEAYIQPRLGKTALKDLTPSQIQRLYTRLKTTLSLSSVRYSHSVLHGCLAHAVALKLIRSNPTTGLKLPKQVAVDICYLRGPEIPSFLTAARSSKHGELFEFLLATGCRPGEGRGLMWSDVDFKAGTVQIQRTVSDAKPLGF